MQLCLGILSLIIKAIILESCEGLPRVLSWEDPLFAREIVEITAQCRERSRTLSCRNQKYMYVEFGYMYKYWDFWLHTQVTLAVTCGNAMVINVLACIISTWPFCSLSYRFISKRRMWESYTKGTKMTASKKLTNTLGCIQGSLGLLSQESQAEYL